MRKNGRSIIYIGIAILIVIISLAIVATMLFSSNIKMQAESFSKELIELEENVKKLTEAGSDLPVENIIKYNKDSLLTLLSKTEQSILATEIKENGDEGAEFLVLDTSKLGTNTVIHGDRETCGADIFVVAIPSHKVYYVAGMKIDGQIYYSVTQRLAKATKYFDLDDKIVGGVQTATGDTSSNISSETKSWTNALSIKIPVLIGQNRIVMKIGEKELDITDHILDRKYILKETEDTPRNLLESVNTVVIKKIDKKGNLLEKDTVDISNLDVTPPTIEVKEEYFKVENKATFNLVNVTPKDDKSGVDYVVYEYTKKKNSKGQIENVKDTSIIDKEEITKNLINTGERSKDGVIKVPLYISEFRLLVVDKAGNKSEYIEVKIPDTYVSNEVF